MSKTKNEIMSYALIGFLLLAILFGMQIMTFIFGQLGPTNSGLTISDPGYNESLQIQNNSLNAIENYSTGAGTQFNVLQIVITLILLVGVFVFFWKTFMGSKKQGGAMGGSFG